MYTPYVKMVVQSIPILFAILLELGS